jgi:hypothetical protein
MLEAMRARLEKAAKGRGVSLNAEIVGRLQQSLTGAESFLADLLGSREKLLFAMNVADIIREAERETGHGWLDDRATYKRAAQVIIDWVRPSPDDAAAQLREIREIMNARLWRGE